MDIPPIVLVLVMGWPAAAGSAFLGVAGSAAKRPLLSAGGAVLGTPFLLYLSGGPRFEVVAPIVLLLYYGSVIAAFKEKRGIAALLLAPFILLLIWFFALP